MVNVKPFSFDLRVYIEDTDAGGIVYYVNYLKFMERARTEMMREIGYEKPAIFDSQLMFVVHSVNVNYRKPAVLDDVLTVKTHVTDAARTWFELQQHIFRGDELLCEGRVKVACVDQIQLKPRALPPQMIEKLPPMLEN